MNSHDRSCFTPMALRREFLRSLQNDNGAASSEQLAPVAVDDAAAADRRAYFLSVREPTAASPAAPVAATVNFGFAALREFQAATRDSGTYKKQSPIPIKRPNYNSKKRKFYANPPDRNKYLGLAEKHVPSCSFNFQFVQTLSPIDCEGPSWFPLRTLGSVTMALLGREWKACSAEIAASVIVRSVFDR